MQFPGGTDSWGKRLKSGATAPASGKMEMGLGSNIRRQPPFHLSDALFWASPLTGFPLGPTGGVRQDQPGVPLRVYQ